MTLPAPDDSPLFFETIKTESEKFWHCTVPNNELYGFQFQQDSEWRPGLSDEELHQFETSVGLSFPRPLRNFYKSMNGLTKQGINVYGNNGTAPDFRSVFYSYPVDLQLIMEQIEWIYDSMSINKDDLERIGISGILPVYQHRFMLLDIPGNPILSMYGDDIIYYADNLSKLLVNEIFTGIIYNVTDFESSTELRPEVRFWLD